MPADEELDEMPGAEDQDSKTAEAASEGVAEATAEDTTEGEPDLKERLKKDLAVQMADVGVLRKSLKITVPRETIQVELDKDYQEIIGEAVVPGFRRGRAPRRLVEKRFGNEIGEQVVTRLVSNAFLAATERENLQVIGDPSFRVAVKDRQAAGAETAFRLVGLREALANLKLPDEGDFTFECEVEIKPEFDLPPLERIPVKKRVFKVTDEDVTNEIKRMLAHHANWVPVVDAAVQADDLLICDVRIVSDGREVKKLENASLAARPQVIEGMACVDFGKTVAGAKNGETRTLSGTLPDDYELTDLRGKAVSIEVQINEVKRLEYPPLDQAFFDAAGFDSEADYRDWIKSRMEVDLNERAVADQRAQIRQYLLANTKLDLPEGLSLRQTARAITRMVVDMQRRGVPDAIVAKYADELRTSAKEQAINDLKLTFILDKIAEQMDLDVTEEEVNSAIAEIASSYNRRFDRVRDDLVRSGGLESLYTNLREEKCIDRLLADAEISELAESSEEASPRPAEPSPTAAGPESATPEKQTVTEEPEKPRPKRTPPPKKSDA